MSGSTSGDWKREPIKGLPRQSSTLLGGSVGVLATNSTAVVHFSSIDRRKIRREEIPSHCGRGRTSESLERVFWSTSNRGIDRTSDRMAR